MKPIAIRANPCKFSKLENVHIRLAPLKCYVGRFDFFLGFSRVITGICSRPWSDCILAEYNLTLNKYEGYSANGEHFS